MRVSEDKITKLDNKQVFVFGSNEAGLHGAGAAMIAYRDFGANYHQGFGLTVNRFGKTFAIPTKDWDIVTLSLPVIQFYINRFLDCTKIHPEYDFLVTQIGCGLAGYTVPDIAPLFKKALLLENVYLPLPFINYFETHAERISTVN